ncbi:ATPase with role in protein import into the ER [Tulasnella sp. 408]|nr:ATPase with role in protein import into the ER [Tulasnella sp. 408]
MSPSCALTTVSSKSWLPLKKTDTDASKDDYALGKLNHEVEKAKRTLSQMSTKLEIEFFEGGNDFTKTLTYAKFEEFDLFRKTVKPLDQVLKDSGTKKEDVVLVGASHSNLARPPQPPPRRFAFNLKPLVALPHQWFTHIPCHG